MASHPVDGTKIRALRLSANIDLSVTELVKKLREQGVHRHPDTIRNVELGRQQPGDKLLNALARIFGVDREALLADSETATP